MHRHNISPMCPENISETIHTNSAFLFTSFNFLSSWFFIKFISLHPFSHKPSQWANQLSTLLYCTLVSREETWANLSPITVTQTKEWPARLRWCMVCNFTPEAINCLIKYTQTCLVLQICEAFLITGRLKFKPVSSLLQHYRKEVICIFNQVHLKCIWEKMNSNDEKTNTRVNLSMHPSLSFICLFNLSADRISSFNSHKRARLPASNPSSLKRTMARVWGTRS